MTGQLAPAGAARTAGGERRAALVAMVESRAGATGAGLRHLPAGVTGLEVRADLSGDLDPGELRARFSGQLTYALRSQRYGGRSADPPPLRRARLLAAARGYDLVDLEADHDLVPEVLAGIPAHRRRISWYGGDADLGELRRRFDQLARVPAALYLLAPRARSLAAALAPLRLLATLGRQDITAFGTGPAATFSRVLAPWLGAPVVYGSRQGPTVDQLVTDYPFPELPRLESLCGIVGRLQTPLFLRRVNAAFRERSVPSLLLPITAPDLADFRPPGWPAVAGGLLDELGVPLRALTVAAPYKPAAFAAAALADPPARAARAANLLLREGPLDRPGQRWRATITTGSAVRAALLDAGPLAGVPVAVVGCGAAGRAAAFALSGAGARVTLVNRGVPRGRRAAAELELPFVPLAGFDPGRYPVLVHATPAADQPPFELDDVAPGTTIADFVCGAGTSALVAAARRRGLTAIDGRDILAQEVRHQLQLMAGRPDTVPAHHS
jgi:3-dehydroquinate dehydratase/shikimate dehydrogenase